MKHFRFRTDFLFRVVPIVGLLAAFAVADAASSIGKVRYILGEVTIQKKAKDGWNPLRIGLKVKNEDLIRTLVESEAGIALSDGSLITIEENTTIRFGTAVSRQNESGTTVELRTGRVFFDVQKRREGNPFEFKTGTATAAIRGTNGFIESGAEGVIVSLESGKMLVTDNSGKTLEVNGGETLVQDPEKGLQKFKTPSSGTRGLAKEIASEKKAGTFHVDSLQRKAVELDKRNRSVMDSLAKNSPCDFAEIASKTTRPEIPVGGKCRAGVSIRVNGVEIPLSEKGTFDTAVSFGKESFGQKRTRITCSVGGTEMLCLEAFTEYLSPTSNDENAFIRIKGERSPQGVAVKGEFFSEDENATVTVSLGKSSSENLNTPNARGHFSYTFPESEIASNAKRKFAVATLSSKARTWKDSVEIFLPPKIRLISANGETCEMAVAISGVDGRKIRVEEFVDGIPATKAFVHSDISRSVFPMLPGKHHYRILASDSEGNHSEISETFVCKE